MPWYMVYEHGIYTLEKKIGEFVKKTTTTMDFK